MSPLITFAEALAYLAKTPGGRVAFDPCADLSKNQPRNPVTWFENRNDSVVEVKRDGTDGAASAAFPISGRHLLKRVWWVCASTFNPMTAKNGDAFMEAGRFARLLFIGADPMNRDTHFYARPENGSSEWLSVNGQYTKA